MGRAVDAGHVRSGVRQSPPGKDRRVARRLRPIRSAGGQLPTPFKSSVNVLDRYRGAILGLAAGDALGTTLEFAGRGTFDPITDMVGGGPFNLKPGEWTDDTSMALCLAESLIT